MMIADHVHTQNSIIQGAKDIGVTNNKINFIFFVALSLSLVVYKYIICFSLSLSAICLLNMVMLLKIQEADAWKSMESCGTSSNTYSVFL